MGININEMVDTINKEIIAAEISEELGLSKAQSQEMLNDIIESMIEIIYNDGKLRVPYFGTFHIKKKTPRIGRNPKTRQEYNIPARQLITFKASDFFKTYINDNQLD